MRRRLALGGLVVLGLSLSLGARRLGAGEAPPPAPDGLVPVTIRDVRLDAATHSPLVILETAKKDRALVIVVGHAEAIAILRRVREMDPLPRPMTHDLLQDVITRLGAQLHRIVITRLDHGTFHAELVVHRGESHLRIDARPSDAMALALRAGAPILVARPVLDEAGIDPGQLDEPDRPKPERRPAIDPDRAI